MLHRLLRNCITENHIKVKNWFEIITEPELRVNVGYAFISAAVIM